jgi:hypothetical protein
MRPSELRVAFTGHCGLSKGDVIRRLRDFIRNSDPDRKDLTKLSSVTPKALYEQGLIGVYEIEKFLVMDTFLLASMRDRQRLWKDSFCKVMEEWKASKPRYAFFSLHLTYQVLSEFFSPFSWIIDRQETLLEFMKEINPHYVVTLIDDIHSVRARIKPGYSVRLSDLLRWRQIEIMMTDILAQRTIAPAIKRENPVLYPFERSPAVAIRHPVSMIYSYLFEPDRLRVYASFPISEPRRRFLAQGTDEPIREVNRFRRALRKWFTVFDPVTIDEIPLQSVLNLHQSASRNMIADVLGKELLAGWRQLHRGRRRLDKFVTQDGFARAVEVAMAANFVDTEIGLGEACFWPLGYDEEGTLRDDLQAVDIRVSHKELEEVATHIGGSSSEIERQVRSRDYRLIDQSDVVVIYRPTYNKKAWSEGTRHEYEYALRNQKLALVVRDPREDGSLHKPPFQVPPVHVIERNGLADQSQFEAAMEEVKSRIDDYGAKIKQAGFRTPT